MNKDYQSPKTDTKSFLVSFSLEEVDPDVAPDPDDLPPPSQVETPKKIDQTRLNLSKGAWLVVAGLAGKAGEVKTKTPPPKPLWKAGDPEPKALPPKRTSNGRGTDRRPDDD